MAVKGTIFFKDKDDNDLKGSREDGSSLILDFQFGYKVPFDSQENLIRGKRNMIPFTVTKEIDQLTPQLFQMICENHYCKQILINLFRIDPETGTETAFFLYEFHDAPLIQIMNKMPSITDSDNEDLGHLEVISFIAKEVKWVFKKGNIEYIDKPSEHFKST